MNNKVILAIIVLALLIGAGGWYMMNQSSQVSDTVTQTMTEETTQDNQTPLFTSLQDMFSKSLSVECTFTDESGKKVTSYIKNGSVRVNITGASQEESGYLVAKDQMMHFWDMQKKGFSMKMPQIDPNTNYKDTPGGASQNINMLQNIEKYKQSCKPATIDDSLFIVPSDVTLTDMSAMMQNMPTIDPNMMKKMMEQYQPEQ